MGDSGIISQYGFLYQRKVFTWDVLSTLNVNSTTDIKYYSEYQKKVVEENPEAVKLVKLLNLKRQ